MKKYHLYLWIIALVGLMTSCSQDETDALQTDTNANRVTLTASLPEDFAQIGTRALPTAPTNYKLRCVLEVWDMEETPALKVRKEVCPAAGDTQIDFTFELATTGRYIAMLWADYIPYDQTARPQEIAGLTGVESFGDKHYITTNGLKAVETNSTNTPKVPEAWDAFFASIQFTKKEKALTLPTTALNRPLMKLTIAEKNAERFTSCNMVTAEFNCPSKFNVATGTVIETKSVGINATDGWLNNGTDITIGGQTCKTLICLYMFADPADGTMGDIKLEFTASEEGKSLSPVTIPAGIPRKRNYCINAAGNLIGESLSPTVDISVEINSGWKPDEEYDYEVGLVKKVLDDVKTAGSGNIASDYTYTITTPEQLAALATLAKTNAVITGCTKAKYGYANYVLGKNINLENKPWTPIDNFYGTFDGQGNTISNMNVSITPQSTSDIYGGLFGLMAGTVSNLIVEGAVTVEGAGYCYAGGICGRLAGTIEFCRFNGTVSSTNTDSSSGNYAGGIMGDYVGPTRKITGCIANAKATISGGKAGESGAGGLAGCISDTDCKYSAWNSDSNSEGTSDMVGKNANTSGAPAKGNNPFTSITELNGLLDGINNGVTTSTYKWQAGSTGTDYPILVPRN